MKLNTTPPLEPLVPKIKKVVCRSFNAQNNEIQSLTRKQVIVTARQVMFYLAKKYSDLTLAQIGVCFREQPYDHTTVRHGIKTILDELDTDEELRFRINEVELLLGFDYTKKKVIIGNFNRILVINQ